MLAGGQATTKSDVFSFAVVLWELLTWQLPWQQEAKNAFQVGGRIGWGRRALRLAGRGASAGALEAGAAGACSAHAHPDH